jgi:nucleotide-binding universal stress UspA family protein
MIPIKNILVPTDFSEPATAAIEYATAFATEFGATMHLLHVVPEPYAFPWGTQLPNLPAATLLTESEEAAREHLDQVARTTGLPKNRTMTHAVIGSPVQRILEYVIQKDISLIVMGTHGRGTVEHLLLGSVVERVVRRSPTPVFTVHGPTRAQELRQKLLG